MTRVERPRSPCYSPSSPTVNDDYDYHHCAYEYRPDCTCKGCVDARPPASSSPTYAPSSPEDVHHVDYCCDNADYTRVGCAAVRAAHSPRASPCYAPTSPPCYHYCPNDYMDGCTCVGCRS